MEDTGQGASLREDDGLRDRAHVLRLVCFMVRGQELAIPIGAVRETIRMRPITRVFLTPSWLVGIFSLRGEILPAIDIAPWLALSSTEVSEDSRLVVLSVNGKVVGLLADALTELRVLERDAIEPVPTTLSGEQAALLSGVATTSTGTVRILDPAGIFSSERLRALSQPAST